MKNSWKRLLALLCGVCMSVFAGFALVSCKNPEGESSSEQSSTEQAHVHAWDNGVVASTSTCSKQGETVFTCTACGETRVEYAPLAAHNYEAVETVAPTCTEKGYTLSRCSACLDEIRGNFTNAAGHDYETSVQPATCTSHEITTYDCKNCDEDDYSEITAVTTGHNTQGATWTVSGATPIENGSCMYVLTESTTCQNAGCGATITRTVAEPVHRPLYSHEITTPATCTTEGVITYTCACGNSDYTYTTNYAGVGHNWVEGETVNGVTTYTCSHDSAHTKQTVSAQKVDDTSSKLSTEALAGTTAAEVEVTDNTKMQMDSALLGELTQGQAQDVTFVAEELTGDNIPDGVDTSRLEEGATVYNFDLKDASGNPLFGEGSTGSMTITVPYTLEGGEDPSSIVVLWLKDNGDVVSSPAIYDAVEGTATFTVNHFSYYTVVRMTAEERCARDGHKNVTVVVPNDCTHGGYTLTVCGVCGKEERTNITNPTGHTYATTVVAPTCMDRGYTRYACTNAGCQESYVSNLVEKIDHVYTDSVVAPTCTEKGYTMHVCVCGKSYSDTYVAATGHSYANGVCTVCGEDAPEDYLKANNFYFNLIDSIAKQDKFYLEVEDISFTVDVEMEGMEAHVLSEVDMYRLAFRIDKNGYIVGQGEGKVKAQMTQIRNGQSMTMVQDMEMIVVFQNGKIYMFQKLAETQNGQTNREAAYIMTPQESSDLGEMEAMYEEVFGDSISNILKGMMAQENNPLNTVMATVLEYLFTKTETANGYTFTANYDALPGIYDGLTEMTVAEVYDAFFGAGAYLKAYNYIYSVPDKTIEQLRNDIVAWAMKFGVDIKDVYAAINGLANNMPSFGPSGGNEQDGPQGGSAQGQPMPKPTNAGEEPEATPFSIEEIITQYRDKTVAQVLDMMMGAPEGQTGLEQYKAMIAQMGAPADENGENGGMLTMMSIADIALGSMGGGENANQMMEMVGTLMTFVDEQLTALAEALEGTSSISFTTDKEGNVLTLAMNFTEFEHEITIDGMITAILSAGDMEEDITVSIVGDGKVSVVMGGSYIAEYNHIVTGLEKSTSIFDNIKQTLELTKKEEYYIDKEQDIKIYVDRPKVLVPTEKGVIYAPAFDGSSTGSPYDLAEDTYQGQPCMSYKVRVWGDTPLLLAPEQGISYADSCNGWKKYTSKAYYCHEGTIYKVYATQNGTVLGYELDVEATTEDAGQGSAYESMELYYNAGLNRYSLNDPHNWILTKSVIPQECEEYGYHAYRCSVCGNEMVENLYMGHESDSSYQLVAGADSCEEGLKQVWTCRLCGEVTHESKVDAAWAATHPTFGTKSSNLPGKTDLTCPMHYLVQWSCVCGQHKEEPQIYGGEFAYVYSYSIDHEGLNVNHSVEIYRCPVNTCAYTYARETYTVYSTVNCTATTTRTLHLGINYVDGTDTFTGGTPYTITTVSDWHESGAEVDTTEGNILTYTRRCDNCNKVMEVRKYEILPYYANGEEREYHREIYYVHYEYDDGQRVDAWGWEREYHGCNRDQYELYYKNGELVRSDSPSESRIDHAYIEKSWQSATCSQFGVSTEECVVCHTTHERKTVNGYHKFSYQSEIGVYVCHECGMVSETGANGAFVLEDMTEDGQMTVGYLNRYNRRYEIRIFLNYELGVDAIDVTNEIRFAWERTERGYEDYNNDGWYWARECGIVSLNMYDVANVLENYSNVNTLSVVFVTEYNYESEDGEFSDALEYGIHFEVGKAGTYKLKDYSMYESFDYELTADDFVIVLNSDFTFTIFTDNGVQAFASEGTWKVYGDVIRLYDEYGAYDDINADLCLWNEYGYWYFEKV